MANDFKEIEYTVQCLLKDSNRQGGLTEVEKLVIGSIIQGMTYGQASAQYKYTESSLQNAASKLFKDLSRIIGVPINRRNFREIIQKEREVIPNTNNINNDQTVFDRIQANFWVRGNRAQIISVGYSARQVLEMTGYLIKYSPQFEATFCLDMSEKVSVIEMLWSLCGTLQITVPSPRNNVQNLLKIIGGVLQARSTLLVLRFDRSTSSIDRTLGSDCADALMSLAMMDRRGTLLVIDNDPVGSEAELKRSLGYQLRSKIEAVDKNAGNQAIRQ